MLREAKVNAVATTHNDSDDEIAVEIPIGSISLQGSLRIPEGGRGIVLFAHGSGSSRHSPRNRSVADALRQAGLATLLIDLLTEAEERADRHDARLRFDIELLAERLQGDRLMSQHADARIGGYFGEHGAPPPCWRRPGSEPRCRRRLAWRLFEPGGDALLGSRRHAHWAARTAPSFDMNREALDRLGSRRNNSLSLRRLAPVRGTRKTQRGRLWPIGLRNTWYARQSAQ